MVLGGLLGVYYRVTHADLSETEEEVREAASHVAGAPLCMHARAAGFFVSNGSYMWNGGFNKAKTATHCKFDAVGAAGWKQR